jgi:hypothetical protein
MWKSIFIVLVAWLAAQEAAFGQVASADVNIIGVTFDERSSTCTVVINNQNDDDAQWVNVIVLMPLQVTRVTGQVVGGTGSCIAVGAGNFQAYAICNLGTLPQGASVRRTVIVKSNPSTADPNVYPPTCGAFIYSAVGDIKKTNNYCVAGKSCPPTDWR